MKHLPGCWQFFNTVAKSISPLLLFYINLQCIQLVETIHWWVEAIGRDTCDQFQIQFKLDCHTSSQEVFKTYQLQNQSTTSFVKQRACTSGGIQWMKNTAVCCRDKLEFIDDEASSCPLVFLTVGVFLLSHSRALPTSSCFGDPGFRRFWFRIFEIRIFTEIQKSVMTIPLSLMKKREVRGKGSIGLQCWTL